MNALAALEITTKGGAGYANIGGAHPAPFPINSWFVMLVAVALQTSFLTPPAGFALFYLNGICPRGVTLADIYKGVVPFILLQLIGLSIVVAFPKLVTWLPAVAYG